MVMNDFDRAWLRQIVRIRCPEAVPLLAKLGIEPLADDERERLRGAVADEGARLMDELRIIVPAVGRSI